MFNETLVFHPVYQQRPWGGRMLEHCFGRTLPEDALVGESWELVDRPEAQSAVSGGLHPGETLHSLWTRHRKAVFGNTSVESERFPLLIKLLDARETLSVQVHPSGQEPGLQLAEPKNEWWYVLEAAPGAAVYAGFREGVDKAAFERALQAGNVESLLHRIEVKKGDSLYVPVGRCHAIGAGCLIAEVQQNSDTTYRVFDWNRVGLDGQPRALHVAESLACIDFNDHEPPLAAPLRETPFRCEFFGVEQLEVDGKRTVRASEGALFMVIQGCVGVGQRLAKNGDWFVLPESAGDVEFSADTEKAELLRVSLPS